MRRAIQEEPNTPLVNGPQVVADDRLTDDLARLRDVVGRGDLAEAWEMVRAMERQCALQARVISPAQPGSIRRNILGTTDLPKSERKR